MWSGTCAAPRFPPGCSKTPAELQTWGSTCVTGTPPHTTPWHGPRVLKPLRLIDLIARTKTWRFMIGSCCVSEGVCYFCTEPRKRPLPTGKQRGGGVNKPPRCFLGLWGWLGKLQTTHRLISGVGGGADGANPRKCLGRRLEQAPALSSINIYHQVRRWRI